MKNSKREYWIDNTKVIACILVVLGHLFQGLVKAEVFNNTLLYHWFDQTIYYFHVPLFFICSGYLYQRTSVVNSFVTWKNNILKKLLILGVPYFSFSIITWIIKNLISSDINSKTGALFYDLFISPSSPYWYLLVLFIFFFITPTMNNKLTIVIYILLSLVLKFVWIFGMLKSVDMLCYTANNYMWFVSGMVIGFISRNEIEKKKSILWFGLASSISFGILCVVVFQLHIYHGIISMLLCILACFGIMCLCRYFNGNYHQNKVMAILSSYTMPIFLMHTIFAAAIRIILLKFQVSSCVIHLLSGIFFSYFVPIICYKIMKQKKWLEFFVNPAIILPKRS